MENLDVRVLRSLLVWQREGKRALLATVVRTWGSSPRPVGSIMALSEDGSVVGSVSGGCIEDDLIHRYSKSYAWADEKVSAQTQAHSPVEPSTAVERAIPSGPPILVKYGVSADDAHRFGLPCGGTLELLLEFDTDTASLSELIDALQSRQLMRRIVRLRDGAVVLQHTSVPSELQISSDEIINTFGPEYRMLLIGAGQLTEYLATMATFSGFAVTVCDPRVEYRGAWAVDDAVLTVGMPDDVVVQFAPDSRSCVIALTHDPKLDDLALLEALKTDAFYVGAIGSRRNNEARHARMIEHFGLTSETLARLRGPVGIYIGSKTPAEIAVSVMAEVLAVKNSVTLPSGLDVTVAKNMPLAEGTPALKNLRS
jgi:xanthine dehydrogenase accessory factor